MESSGSGLVVPVEGPPQHGVELLVVRDEESGQQRHRGRGHRGAGPALGIDIRY